MKFLKNIFNPDEQPIRTYQDFWNWFIKHEKKFHKAVKNHDRIEEIFFDALSPRLDELNEDIYFLTGMTTEDTAELILSTEGVIKYVFLVEELVAAAPEIDGWVFTALKPAHDITDVKISTQGYDFDEENLFFYSNVHEEFPDEIDISIVHKDATADNEDIIRKGVYLFLDHLLGELNSIEIIDSLHIVTPDKAKEELIPIGKLKAFLNWRQKEFIERYEGTRRDTNNDTYSMFEGTTGEDKPLLALVNTDLLKWNAKASHPWLLTIDIKYDGADNNGLPEEDDYELLNEIEDNILLKLKDHDGYLNLGRRTANSLRTIYFACKEYRVASKVVLNCTKQYEAQLEMNYTIYKDKYWMAMRPFARD